MNMKINALQTTKIPNLKPVTTQVANSKEKEPQKDTFVSSKRAQGQDEKSFFEKIKDKIKPYKDKIAIGLALLGGIILGLGKGHNDRVKMKNDVENLQTSVRDLENDKQNLKNELDAISTPENFGETVDNIRRRINAAGLDYDPTVSPLGNRDNIPKDKSHYINLPEKHVKTNNRINQKPYTPPKFVKGKNYSAHIPDSNEEKITHQHSSFTEMTQKTTITEDYADSVQWDSSKIARDLIQNFYDGHGQTLNGVDINFEKQSNGKYKVRISGKSTYSPDKAVLLGESSKRDNLKAAGNYGEGLKMVVLKLLKDGKSDFVKIASDDWSVDWKLTKGDLNDKRVLTYDLKKAQKYSGNYIEFETSDTKLLNSIVENVNSFYYAGNEQFINPDFENEQFGFKLLPKGEKGGIYIAGQQFEYDGEYNNIDGITLFIKEKPPAKFDGEVVFDPSRDRISLTKDNVEAISKWLAKDTRTTKEDLAKVFKALEPLWERTFFSNCPTGINLLTGLIDGAESRSLKFNFPDNCLAYSYGASEFEGIYRQAGYKICLSGFSDIGMKDLRNVVEKDQQHTPLKPTEQELKKIKILREAVSILSPLIKDVGFEASELKPNIYIFDNKESSDNEHSAYQHVEGEAIVQHNQSKGFWIDRTQLNSKDFAGLLTTSLHEITHKFGGDNSAIFSYKLTDVIEGVLKAAQEHPGIALQLKALEKVWNE